jgi:uncharacterized protein YbjQ (UPF0145 family)
MYKQFALGEIVLSASRKALDLIKNTLVDSIKEAADYEKAIATLDATFIASGRNMPGMVAHLKAYADELQALGLADDGAILKSEALLLRMTNLDEKGIKESARLAAGLAYVYDMDLNSATELVGKGMEGVYRGFISLSPAVVNATTDADKHAAMMKFLNDTYAAAQAQTGTYSGQVKQLGLTWNETKKNLGETILSTNILQEAMKGLSDIIKGISGETARQHKKSTEEQIIANNAAYETLIKVAEATGRTNLAVANQAMQYHLTYEKLLEWVKGGDWGETGQRALAKVTGEQTNELEKQKKQDNETGIALGHLTKLTDEQKKAQEAANKVLKDLFSSQDKTVISIRSLIQNQTDLTTALKLGVMDAETYRAGMERLQQQIEAIGNTAIVKVATPAVRDFSAALKIWAVDIQNRVGIAANAWSEGAKGMAEVWKEKLEKIKEVAGPIIADLGAIFAQANTNRLAEIDNEYNARKTAILNGIGDEEQKNYRLNNLDKEFEVKRRDASRAYAREQKAMSIFNATISAAEGVVNALKVPPAPNIFLAAIMSALGLAKIGFIAAQPLPLAKGAIFNRSTILTSSAGAQYEVGEAGTEVLASPKQIQQAIMGGGAGGRQRGGRPITIILKNYIGTEQISEQIAKVVINLDSLGKLKLKKAFA